MMYDVYGATDGRCWYCNEAKTLLDREELEYTYHDVDDPQVKELLIERLEKSNVESRTIPQIFKGDEYIGGYTELHIKLENDRVDEDLGDLDFEL